MTLSTNGSARQNAMDFDDLLKNWLILMSTPEIGERISQQFRYVLVDEYQDINALKRRSPRPWRAHIATSPRRRR